MKEKVKVKTIEEGIDGAPPWIATFVDMISLLVTFFILLFSFSRIKEFETFSSPKNILGSRGTLPSLGNAMTAPKDDLMLAMDINRGSRVRHTRPVDQLTVSLDEMGQRMTSDHLEIDLRTMGDGLRVEFDADAAFSPGSAEVPVALPHALMNNVKPRSQLRLGSAPAASSASARTRSPMSIASRKAVMPPRAGSSRSSPASAIARAAPAVVTWNIASAPLAQSVRIASCSPRRAAR
jgi:hypothetical protein